MDQHNQDKYCYVDEVLGSFFAAITRLSRHPTEKL